MHLEILVHHGHHADREVAGDAATDLEEPNAFPGAVPNEKITWGKLDIQTPKFIVESDATIVAPLIFAWILGM